MQRLLNEAKIELEITDATQYATAYCNGHPVATFQRGRVYSRGPAWEVFDAKGDVLFATMRNLNAEQLIARLERALARKAA